MKTCFNTITAGGDKPLETILDQCGACGYDGVEMEFGAIDAYIARNSKDSLKAHLERAGLQAAAIMAFPFFAFNKEQQNEHLKNVERLAEMAKFLGSKTLLCFICDAPPEGMPIAEALAVAGQSAQRYGEVSGQFGVSCALEPIGMSPFMPGPRQALAVAGASGSPYVGVMMDTFHYYKSGIGLDEIKILPKDRLLIVHVNDCPALPLEDLTDAHRVYPGQGALPLVETFRILQNQVGYEGFLSIEIFNQSYWQDDPANVVKSAKAGLDSVLAAL